MDILALFIGIVIGIIVGFAVAWVWANSITTAKKSATQSTESDLKTLLAQQAKSHLEASRESIQTLESELNRLLTSVKDYEQSLSVTTEDYSKNTFFGEHASMFLRNTGSESNKTIATKSTDNQPKDFANSGSGVFAGSPAAQVIVQEEKTSN
ncbi:MAG: uncharacterized membrane-anchored protein YhcB (DUF1043 family) [Alphaproteobacteria bacterium]|jgi:uncharacterized membrane-anchored protein YhcB (DUF1043 family)